MGKERDRRAAVIRSIIIIVEGATEEEFVKGVLRDYFFAQGIADVRPIQIQTSRGHKGGLVDFGRFERDVQRYLKAEHDILVTSLIDYFRMPNDFPGYQAARQTTDAMQRVEYLEQALADKINHRRFIPYFQLHEFEGLLFSNIQGFTYLPNLSPQDVKKIQDIMGEYSNPELINDGSETVPSKRLLKIIPRYQKSLDGPIIALENGIHSILHKCPRFRNWIALVIEKAKSL